METILITYYENNARKLHRVVDKILIKFGGLSNKDLLDFYQYSPNLEIVPPYLYAWVRLKEQGENFGIIIDGNGDVILEVGGRFFELDRKN